MDKSRELIFPAGAFPANLRSILERQTNAKQMQNQEILIEFTGSGKVWGLGRKKGREGKSGGVVKRGRYKIQKNVPEF